MDELFEAYVAERLQQVAHGVEIAIQGPIRPFAVDGSFPLRPDVVVIAAGHPVLVLDTKWKRLDRGLNDADPADLRQVYAYARVYGVNRAVLVYPGTSAAQCLRRDFIVNDCGAIILSICQLPLLEDRDGELDRILSDLVAPKRGFAAAPSLPGTARSILSSINS
jgi:5-methylcytosine-specific restriction endonuclease McrBC regulatory subunit McrC